MTYIKRYLFFVLALLLIHAPAYSWPIQSQWIPILKNAELLQDPNTDAQGSRNIVSDPTHDAAFMYNDFEYIHFRLRLDKDPSGTGGQGFLEPYGWGVELDTNFSVADYEWLLLIDGIAKTETILLQQNSIQGTLGDPGDKSETICASLPVSGNFRVVTADTSINGDQDYFLDWRFPWSTFKQCTGLNERSPIRMFFGSSSSANSLTERGADLVGASSLYDGFSDYILLGGTSPTTGRIRFVNSLTGNIDVLTITSGDTLFIQVEDPDQNYNAATLQTVTATLTASGDIETIVLTETGVNTGIFSGDISTATATPVINNGVLQLQASDNIVTAKYVDVIDAAFNLYQDRLDTVTIIYPKITLSKAVNKTTAGPGEEVLYTIAYQNLGTGPAHNLIISDSVPMHTSYVAGSLKSGTASATYATATPLTDAAGDDAGTVLGGSIVFNICIVTEDDGSANSGTDEGKVYFKVKIN